MPSRLSAIFRSVLKVFNCTRKPKEAFNGKRKTNETDELDDIPNPQFPCYKLPLLVQEHIVRFMDTYEIIQSSLVSPRYRVAARLAKPKLDFLSFAENRYSCSYSKGDEIIEAIGKIAPTIHFKVNDQCNYFIIFFWQEQKDQLDVILEEWELTKISEDLWMAVVDCNIIIYNSSTIYSKLDVFQFIFDIIFRVFTVEFFNLGGKIWYDSAFPKKHKFPLALRYRNLVQYLKLVQTIESDTCADLNSDELSALLDNLKVPRIEIMWNGEPGAKYTGTLKTKKMELYGTSWLTMDNILTMECEDFTGIGARWTAPELISIVRKWQDGGFEKLKRLELENDHGDWSHVLDAIEGTNMPGWSGKEIRRSDGKKAEVFVDEYDFMINVLD